MFKEPAWIFAKLCRLLQNWCQPTLQAQMLNWQCIKQTLNYEWLTRWRQFCEIENNGPE